MGAGAATCPLLYHLGGGMSVWAQAWAYEQRAGSAGAKAVLVALAVFADVEGLCYPSQERIAGMTEQGVRTVRLHLASLEETRLIERRRRRRPDGKFLSDGFVLLAPAKRLKPHIPSPDETLRQILPTADIAAGYPVAESAAGEKPDSLTGQGNSPVADSAVGRSCQRQKTAEPAADSAKPPRPPYKEEVNLTEPSKGARFARRARAREAEHKMSLEDFHPNEKQIDQAIGYGVPAEQVAFETEQWRDHHTAKGDVVKDAAASWRTWMRNVPKFSRGSPTGQYKNSQEKTQDAITRYAERIKQSGTTEDHEPVAVERARIADRSVPLDDGRPRDGVMGPLPRRD
jgi:hypothetical protein